MALFGRKISDLLMVTSEPVLGPRRPHFSPLLSVHLFPGRSSLQIPPLEVKVRVSPNFTERHTLPMTHSSPLKSLLTLRMVCPTVAVVWCTLTDRLSK